MTTGERMKQRRKDLGLSAEIIAEKLGVSPATIYRYENGGIEKMPGNILEPIANALRTTPAYLMGWADSDPVQDLTSEENELLHNYQSINQEGQRKLLDYSRDLVSSGNYQKGPSVSAG